MKNIITILAENDKPIDKNIDIKVYEYVAKVAWQELLNEILSVIDSTDSAKVLSVEVRE